jgi:hypothetical protein
MSEGEGEQRFWNSGGDVLLISGSTVRVCVHPPEIKDLAIQECPGPRLGEPWGNHRWSLARSRSIPSVAPPAVTAQHRERWTARAVLALLFCRRRAPVVGAEGASRVSRAAALRGPSRSGMLQPRQVIYPSPAQLDVVGRVRVGLNVNVTDYEARRIMAAKGARHFWLSSPLQRAISTDAPSQAGRLR